MNEEFPKEYWQLKPREEVIKKIWQEYVPYYLSLKEERAIKLKREFPEKGEEYNDFINQGFRLFTHFILEKVISRPDANYDEIIEKIKEIGKNLNKGYDLYQQGYPGNKLVELQKEEFKNLPEEKINQIVSQRLKGLATIELVLSQNKEEFTNGLTVLLESIKISSGELAEELGGRPLKEKPLSFLCQLIDIKGIEFNISTKELEEIFQNELEKYGFYYDSSRQEILPFSKNEK